MLDYARLGLVAYKKNTSLRASVHIWQHSLHADLAKCTCRSGCIDQNVVATCDVPNVIGETCAKCAVKSAMMFVILQQERNQT